MNFRSILANREAELCECGGRRREHLVNARGTVCFHQGTDDLGQPSCWCSDFRPKSDTSPGHSPGHPENTTEETK